MTALNYDNTRVVRVVNRILKLAKTPKTPDQIADEIIVTRGVAVKYLNQLCRSNQMHIHHWMLTDPTEENGRPVHLPYYISGPGVNAEKPKLTNAERCQRHRDKMLNDDDTADKYRAKNRLRKIQPHADPLALPADFFGRLAA